MIYNNQKHRRRRRRRQNGAAAPLGRPKDWKPKTLTKSLKNNPQILKHIGFPLVFLVMVTLGLFLFQKLVSRFGHGPREAGTEDPRDGKGAKYGESPDEGATREGLP